MQQHLCFQMSVVFSSFWYIGDAANNGLAIRPPMGWTSGERFVCNTDCHNYPESCISQDLVSSTAEAMLKYGYLLAGYNYLVVDDCWMATSRDDQGNLVADKQRFSGGIKSLSDRLHSQGFKLGLYLSAGNTTRYGYPGSMGHLRQDAQILASWGVDLLKLDGFGVGGTPSDINSAFEDMGRHLNDTGRPILYNCLWPMYMSSKGFQPNFRDVQQTCNTFRAYNDIRDSWESLEDIMHYMGDNSHTYVNFTGVGSWVDLDQVLISDFGLSVDQQEMQLAVWAIMGAPLFISADLRFEPDYSRELLLNKAVLAISQDPLSLVGYQILVSGQVRIWRRPIMPGGSFAMALLYENISGGPTKVSVKLQDMGLITASAYNITDVFSGQFIGTFKPWYIFNCEVNPTGAKLYQALAVQ